MAHDTDEHYRRIQEEKEHIQRMEEIRRSIRRDMDRSQSVNNAIRSGSFYQAYNQLGMPPPQIGEGPTGLRNEKIENFSDTTWQLSTKVQDVRPTLPSDAISIPSTNKSLSKIDDIIQPIKNLKRARKAAARLSGSENDYARKAARHFYDLCAELQRILNKEWYLGCLKRIYLERLGLATDSLLDDMKVDFENIDEVFELNHYALKIDVEKLNEQCQERLQRAIIDLIAIDTARRSAHSQETS
ncbi:MAG: hypothetical protein VKI81_07505 [Synechococcaceae cyanobacterium]|nr:hypothetical protein [Synechococcaceae cyanobacterium]